MKRALAPLGVFALALAARAAMAATLRFPVPEDSAYYVAAARNLAEGRGFVVDVLWSYATPPLTLPRPAFDLWQPLASLVAAPFMAVFGPSLASAQASSVLLGALAAPFAWAIGRDAAAELRLPPARVASVALAAGLAVGLTPLLVVQGAEPDSSAPFTVLALGACWLVPRALAERSPGMRWRILLGAILGLAYLARQEALYVGLAYLGLGWLNDRRDGVRRTGLTFGAAALLVAPWLFRQLMTWQGSPLGQLLENAWLVRADDIFAWGERPTLASHIALGLPGLLDLRLGALAGNAELLAFAGFPAGVLGLATLVAAPRHGALHALRPLTIAMLLTFAVDTIVFPVASLAGLFAHGAGPLLVLLAVLAALGADRVVDRLAILRRWRRPNGVLAPTLVLILAVPVTTLAASLERDRAVVIEASYAELAGASTGWDLVPGQPIMTDRPMWTSLALGRLAIALPREDPASVAGLARRFGASRLIVNGRDGDALVAALLAYRDPRGTACFRALAAPEPFRVLAFSCPAVAVGTIAPPPILPGG